MGETQGIEVAGSFRRKYHVGRTDRHPREGGRERGPNAGARRMTAPDARRGTGRGRGEEEEVEEEEVMAESRGNRNGRVRQKDPFEAAATTCWSINGSL